MSDPHEYFTFTPETMIPEGRRVYALEKALFMAHDRATADEVVEMAKVFEAWLKTEKPALKAVK
jgi:hypothetical protein